jgi:hypothetical protein
MSFNLSIAKDRMQQKIRLQDFQTAEKNVFLAKNSRHYTPQKFTGYTVYFRRASTFVITMLDDVNVMSYSYA